MKKWVYGPLPRDWIDTASELVLVLLALTAVGVGAYAVANPNGVQFGAPWPVGAEALAVIAGVVVAGGLGARRRDRGTAQLVAGWGLAVAALVLLTLLAVALSFSQL
jgi:hypothetical protein